MIHNSTSASIGESIEKIKESFKKQIDLSSEFFSFDDSNFDEAINCIISPPFFSPLKMVLVGNLRSLPKERKERLIEALSLADNAVVVLSSEIKADKSLVTKIGEIGKVIEPKNITQASINQFIEKQFLKAGKKITVPASSLIAQKLGNDNDLIKSEIGKIVIYANKDLIDVDDIKPVLSENPAAKIFEMIDAVSAGNINKAMEKLGPVANSMEPLAILNMLKRHYRLIAKSKGLGAAQVMSKLRQPQFVAQKLTAQAKKYNITTMRKAFNILLNAEKESKSGKDPLFSVQKAMIRLTGLIK